MDKQAATVHIRRPPRPAGGNSFYRDKSFRGQGTYCGAAETLIDIRHPDYLTAKSVREYDAWWAARGEQLCSSCMIARAGGAA